MRAEPLPVYEKGLKALHGSEMLFQQVVSPTPCTQMRMRMRMRRDTNHLQE